MLSHSLRRLHSRGPSLIRRASAGPGASLQKAFQNSAKAQGRRSAASMQAINGRTDDAAAASAPSQDTDIPASLDITPTAGPLEPSLELKLEAAAPQQARPYPNNVPHLTSDFAPKICVIGVGGAGGNAVNNMIVRGLGGVEYLVCNTDAQALASTLTENRLQLGRDITRGLGCGANPDIGRVAGEESRAELLERVGNANMVFVSAGMGGGTGTGAAPIIAQTCLEAGLLTVGVVTKPFRFEGAHRMRLAEEGLRRMQTSVDTLIVIPNQNLFKMVDNSTTLIDAFRLADDVMLAGVKSVTDLMTMPGLINLDFADVQAVMAGMGNAIMGTGQASGEDRAARAAEDALKNPLLGEISVKTAKGMLVNITGGADMTLHEVDIAAQKVTEEVEDQAANIIFGSAYDHNLEGTVRVSVVATGIEEIDHGSKGGHVYMKQK